MGGRQPGNLPNDGATTTWAGLAVEVIAADEMKERGSPAPLLVPGSADPGQSQDWDLLVQGVGCSGARRRRGVITTSRCPLLDPLL